MGRAFLLASAVALALASAAAADYSGTDRGLKPTVLEAFDRVHYYQVPDDPVGTVVFFHGCARSARNFFPYDEQMCPNCIGFPEHVSHSKQALARGYAVLALEPNDNRVLCWSSSDRGPYVNDQPDVIATVSKFLKDRGLADKPLFLWGASSGGTLALKLPAALMVRQREAKEGEYVPKVSGIISEVATPTGFAKNYKGELAVPDYPPTVFIRMERDGSEQDARENVAFLQGSGVPAAVWTSPVRRIGPTYLSDRSSDITPYQSGLIVAGLRQIGLLSEDGFLLADPHDFDNPRSQHAFGWTQRLQQCMPWLSPTSKTVSLVLRFSPIQQALNVAYARHDAVSDYFSACLRWLESGGKSKFEEVVAKHAVPDGKLSVLTPDRTVPATPKPSKPAEEEKPDKEQPPREPQKPPQEPREQSVDWDNEDVAAAAGVPENKAQKTSWSISWR